MAEIEVAPLGDRLNDDEVVQLIAALEKLGAPALPTADDSTSVTVEDSLDDAILTEFFDRLEAHDIAAEIYVPSEFDGRTEVANLRVGSLVALLEALEEVKDELVMGGDDDEDEEGSEEDDSAEQEDIELIAEQLRRCWKIFFQGAQTAFDRRLPLHVSF